MRRSLRAAPATSAWSSCRAATGAPKPTSGGSSAHSSASSTTTPESRTSPEARHGCDEGGPQSRGNRFAGEFVGKPGDRGVDARVVVVVPVGDQRDQAVSASVEQPLGG